MGATTVDGMVIVRMRDSKLPGGFMVEPVYDDHGVKFCAGERYRVSVPLALEMATVGAAVAIEGADDELEHDFATLAGGSAQ